MAKDGGMSIVMSAIAMTFKRFLPLIVEWDDVKNKQVFSHDLFTICLLLHLETGIDLESFIASTFGYEPSSSTNASEQSLLT